MRPNYKNWMPKGMVFSFLAAFAVSLALFYIFGLSPVLAAGTLKTVLKYVLLALTVVLGLVFIWSVLMYRAFSYNGKRYMSRDIIEGVAKYVEIPDGGTGLDVGCGNGALAIACAKRNPKAKMVGVDRWGKEYASFSRKLCEDNARAEGVGDRTSFSQGDALHLDFADGSFDAVTSNYVYHNIPSRDRQAILLETLRTLRKGGVFAIHDIMSESRYGDMQAFAQKLRDMGYEEVYVIDTASGMFMSRFEAKWMGLSGSKLLVGRK